MNRKIFFECLELKGIKNISFELGLAGFIGNKKVNITNRSPDFPKNHFFNLKFSAAKAVAVISLLFITQTAHAQGLSSGPINVTVPYPAGSGADIVARTVGEGLRKIWNQPIVVENIASNSGITGSMRIVQANPDGHHILAVANTLLMTMAMKKTMEFDPAQDLTPIAHLATGQLALVVNPSVPAKTLPEFIALAKKEPGKLNFASSGVGSGPHLAMELVMQAAEIDVFHVPYPGTPAAIQDVIAGHADVAVVGTQIAGSMAQGPEPKLRILAVLSSRRAPTAPEVPTATENGLPVVVDTFWGIYGPKGMSQEIVAKYQEAVTTVLADAAVREQFTKMDVFPSETIGELGSRTEQELKQWSDLVESAGIEKQ